MPEIATHAVAAVGAGGGVLWLARVLFKRMIDQYDKRHEEHAQALASVVKDLHAALTRLAVLEAVLADARAIRSELAAQRAELETRHAATVEEVRDLRADVWVAHERVRLLADGDVEIDKVKKPERMSRRR